MPRQLMIDDKEYLKFFKRSGRQYVRVGDDRLTGDLTTLEAKETVVIDVATKVTTPDFSGSFTLSHDSSEVLYLGPSGVTSSNGVKVEQGDIVEFEGFKDNDENEIYAVTETGVSITVQVIAAIKE